jgi:hypothetical protein
MTLLEVAGADAAPTPVVATERLIWAGPLTVSTSLVAVHTVRLALLSVLTFPSSAPMAVSLGWIAPTADTIILCGLAVVAFAMLAGFSDDPLRAWQRLAFGALLVSFLPLVMMAPRGAGGSPWSMAAVLVSMHVAAYIPCVTLLPRLTTLTAGPPIDKEVSA